MEINNDRIILFHFIIFHVFVSLKVLEKLYTAYGILKYYHWNAESCIIKNDNLCMKCVYLNQYDVFFFFLFFSYLMFKHMLQTTLQSLFYANFNALYSQQFFFFIQHL